MYMDMDMDYTYNGFTIVMIFWIWIYILIISQTWYLLCYINWDNSIYNDINGDIYIYYTSMDFYCNGP